MFYIFILDFISRLFNKFAVIFMFFMLDKLMFSSPNFKIGCKINLAFLPTIKLS